VGAEKVAVGSTVFRFGAPEELLSADAGHIAGTIPDS
jgi:hypothetical protein